MQEAKYSVSIKLNIEGYDAQITLRSDDDVNRLLGEVLNVLDSMPKNGGKPAQPASEPQPKPQAQPKPQPRAQAPGKPVEACPNCGSTTGLKLIRWNDKNTGEPRQAWKCQDCNQWLRQ